MQGRVFPREREGEGGYLHSVFRKFCFLIYPPGPVGSGVRVKEFWLAEPFSD